MLATAALIALAVAQRGSPEVRVEQLGADTFRITVADGGTDDYQQAQAAIRPTVAKLCPAPRTALWQRFELTGKRSQAGKADGPFRFTQDVHCADPAPAVDSRAPATPPTRADEANARAAFDRFFALRDGGDAVASRAMLSAGTRALGSPEEWAKEVREARTRYAGLHRSIVGFSWSDNPPDAPPGRYAAIDFSGSSDALAISCGYLALRHTAAATWEVARIVETNLPREFMATHRALEANAMLEQGQCAVRLSDAAPSPKPTP